MGIHKKRPVNHHLLHLRHPLPAITSVLHRISGVVLFLTVVPGLYLLQLSLRGPDGFAAARNIVALPLSRVLLVPAAWMLAHHVAAGIRTLCLDVGWGISRESARRTALVANALGLAALISALTVLLWR